MIAPLWKRLLSYLFELHIESTSSEHNPHLYVSLKNGRYQLSTANAIYSYGDLYDNFSEAFQQLNLEQREIKNVLILGFGLGSIPVILEKMQLQYHYTAVEIDEEVVYLASKYVVPHLHSKLEIICADAFAFMHQNNKKYDMIAVDLFLDDIIPDKFQQTDFLNQLKEAIRPNGLLLYNRLNYNDTDHEANKLFYKNTFKTVFEEGRYLEVKGNWMLLND